MVGLEVHLEVVHVERRIGEWMNNGMIIVCCQLVKERRRNKHLAVEMGEVQEWSGNQ